MSCYKCSDRHIGCHSSCERYDNYIKEYHKQQHYLKNKMSEYTETIYQLTKERRIH